MNLCRPSITVSFNHARITAALIGIDFKTSGNLLPHFQERSVNTPPISYNHETILEMLFDRHIGTDSVISRKAPWPRRRVASSIVSRPRTPFPCENSDTESRPGQTQFRQYVSTTCCIFISPAVIFAIQLSSHSQNRDSQDIETNAEMIEMGTHHLSESIHSLFTLSPFHLDSRFPATVLKPYQHIHSQLGGIMDSIS